MTRKRGLSQAHTADDDKQTGMPLEILGMYLFIASEFVFFLTLLFILFWLRSGLMTEWPPPDQPRLPLGITGINTVFLLVSGYTMHRAYRAVKRILTTQLTRWLMITCVLGVVFLTVQGFEWIRLIRFGLSMTSSLYGAMFYSIIGLHASTCLRRSSSCSTSGCGPPPASIPPKNIPAWCSATCSGSSSSSSGPCSTCWCI